MVGRTRIFSKQASKHRISLPFFIVRKQNIKNTEAYSARSARVGASFCFAKK